MSDNWKENVLKNLKNRLKPRNIFKYLKSSPFISSLVIALFFLTSTPMQELMKDIILLD